MKRVPSSLFPALAASVFALTFTARPAGARPVSSLRPGSMAPAASTPPASQSVATSRDAASQLSTTPAQTVVGGVYPTVNIGADHQPDSIDLGEFSSLHPVRRTAVVTITSPTDGAVTARLLPDQFSAGKFQITRLISYKAGWQPGSEWKNRIVSPVDQSVAGDQTLAVQGGQSLQAEVAFQANSDENGVYSAKLLVQGSFWSIEVPVQAIVTVLGPTDPLFVFREGTGYRAVPGQSANLTVRLANTTKPSFTGPGGTNRTVTISPLSLPSGVSMDPVTVIVPPGETQDVTIPLRIDPNAAPGQDLETELQLDAGSLRKILTFSGHIYPTSMVFRYQFDIGDYVHGDGVMEIHSDGSWHWHVNLHDSSGVLGDTYLIGFLFRCPVESAAGPTTTGAVATGTLGSDLSGGTDQSVDQYGPSPALAQNYMDLIDGGYVTYGSTDPDWGSLVKWYVGTGWSTALGLLLA